MVIKAGMIVCLVIVSFITFYITKESSKKKQIQNEIAALQKEAEKIGRENADIRDKIAYLQSKDYQEREAKDKLNLQNPNETLVVIKPNTVKEAAPPKEEPSKPLPPMPPSGPNYIKWWNYFFEY